MFPTRRITTSGGDKFRDEFSLAFDGTNDNIRIPEIVYDVDGSTVSFVFWLKRAALGETRVVLGHTSTANEQFIRFNTSNQIKVESDQANDVATITQNTNDTNWHHYVITSSAGNVTSYQDGVATAVSGNIDGGNLTINTIGGSGTNGTDYEFNGNISEIAIYNKALSASEAKTLYNGREPYNHKEGVCSSNLQAWWRMGDGVLDDRNGLVADQTNATLQSSIITTDLDAQFAELNTDSNNTVTYPTATSVRITTTDGSNVGIRDADLLTAGKTYKCIVDVTLHSGVGIKIQDNSAQHKLIETTGIYTFYFIANDSYFYIFRRNANPTDVTINSLSVQEVNGNAGVTTNMDTDDFEGDTP